MTNKEKIEEIVIDAYEGWTKVGFTDYEMIAILSKLADWFKEHLEKKREKFMKTAHAKGKNPYDYGYINAIDEIINELFPKTEEQDNSNKDE